MCNTETSSSTFVLVTRLLLSLFQSGYKQYNQYMVWQKELLHLLCSVLLKVCVFKKKSVTESSVKVLFKQKGDSDNLLPIFLNAISISKMLNKLTVRSFESFL